MRRAVFNMRDERPVWAPPAWVAERLQAALPDDWTLVDVEAPVTGRGDGGGLSDAALRAVRGAEVYFGMGLPRELLRAALQPPARLRWVHTGAAGVRSLLHPELAGYDVALTNSAGIHAEPMAETVIGMMLHFTRGIDHMVRAQAHRVWDTSTFERTDSGVRELDGATLGVVGYGGIGRAIARRAHALGMRVIALRRTGGGSDEHAEIVSGDDGLDRLLVESDVVVLCVPSTPHTRGLIAGPEIERMRDGAILINIARGDVLDDGALIRALRGGRLRAAALDVFDTEPLPPESPLWDTPNVLISPHVSATTPRFWERECALMLDNLRRYLSGEPLRNRVDVAAGY